MKARTGRYAMFEQLVADGVRHIFGNPGTSEEGFLDSLQEFPQIAYVETLQETIAVAAADGYARARQKPAIIQLHSGVGLGNGIGMLYQALRGHSPLVVIVGEAGLRYDAMDAQMAADLVAIAKPVTKWATRVVDPGSLLRVLRRALRVAATPPAGPVFVSLPMDVLDANNDEEVVPTFFPVTRVSPENENIERAAALLADGAQPIAIIGDGVASSGAQAALARVAELLGARVFGACASEVNLRTTHPLYRGELGHMFGEHSQSLVGNADAVLIVGTYVFPEVFPLLSNTFAKNAKIVHVDLDTFAIGKNFPVDLGIVADPALTLGRIGEALERMLTPKQRQDAAARMAKSAAEKESELGKQLDVDRSQRDAVPMRPARFMEELKRKLPDDTIIFDEALTCSPDLSRYLPPTLPGHFFQTRGGSLGVAIPGAIGVKLANPEKTVIAFSGDGGAMYTIQALWTAVHHQQAVKYVICNNRSYKLLKLNLQQYWKERRIDESQRDFPASFDIGEPHINFADLARSLGVAAARVERPEQIAPAIDEALSHDGPFLIDLVLTDTVDGHHPGVRCGQ